MRYFLDTEFNSYKGQIISLALVGVDFRSLYLVFPRPRVMLPWIHENVMPYLDAVPKDVLVKRIMPYDAAAQLEEFFKGDEDIEIVVDWPDDIHYLSELLLVGAGQMIDIPRIRFVMERIDAWPLKDADKYPEVFGMHAVQHNAWWDAVALRDKFFEVYPNKYPYERQEAMHYMADNGLICPICGVTGSHHHTSKDYNAYRVRCAEQGTLRPTFDK